MEIITSSVVLPVSAAQMAAFCDWIKDTYPTYDNYVGALNAPAAMDTYIIEHLLPQEMKTVLRRSDPFIGARNADIDIQRLLLYRRRVIAKMKNLKAKGGNIVFPTESALTRRANRAAANTAETRREARVASLLREQQQIQADFDAAYAAAYEEWNPFLITHIPLPPPPPRPPKIVKVHLIDEDGELCMTGDCAICMINHKRKDTSIIVNCGHQFGSQCLSKWTGRGGGGEIATCPLCRTVVSEITEFLV